MNAAQALAVGAAASLCSVTPAAYAGVWTLQPQFSASAEYDSNPVLRPDQPESGTAAVANVGLPSSWDDGARHFEIAPRARLAHASGDSPIGEDAYYLTALADLPTERTDFSTSARWGDDSSAIRQPAAGTLVRTNLREEIVDVEPTWSDALTPTVKSTLGATWQTLNYADTAAAAQADLYSYRYATATGQLSDAVTERFQLQLVAQATRYDVTILSAREYSYAAELGFSGTLSPLWSYKLLFGQSLLVQDGFATRSRGTVYVGSLQRAGLQSTWSASVTKSIQPSGFGELAQSLEALASWRWQWSERVSYSFAGRWAEANATYGPFTISDRTYGSIAGSINVLGNEFWTLSAQLLWQRATAAPTFFEYATTAHGYQALLTAERRFGAIRLQ